MKKIASLIFVIVAVGIYFFFRGAEMSHSSSTISEIPSPAPLERSPERATLFNRIDSLYKAQEEFCTFSTKGIQKAKGINIEFLVPCKWDKIDSDKPTLIKQFAIEPNEGELLGASLDITPITLSKVEVEKLQSDKNIKELASSMGEMIEARKLNHYGVPGNRMIVRRKLTANTNLKMYSFINHFYYKKHLVTFSYFTGAYDDHKARELMDKYKTIFSELSDRLVFK